MQAAPRFQKSNPQFKGPEYGSQNQLIRSSLTQSENKTRIAGIPHAQFKISAGCLQSNPRNGAKKHVISADQTRGIRVGGSCARLGLSNASVNFPHVFVEASLQTN